MAEASGRSLTGSGSTYRMRKCSAMERQMAPTSQGLDHGGIFSRDWFSDRLEGTKRRKTRSGEPEEGKKISSRRQRRS